MSKRDVSAHHHCLMYMNALEQGDPDAAIAI
jgi:hypothetical protein